MLLSNRVCVSVTLQSRETSKSVVYYEWHPDPTVLWMTEVVPTLPWRINTVHTMMTTCTDTMLLFRHLNTLTTTITIPPSHTCRHDYRLSHAGSHTNESDVSTWQKMTRYPTTSSKTFMNYFLFFRKVAIYLCEETRNKGSLLPLFQKCRYFFKISRDRQLRD